MATATKDWRTESRAYYAKEASVLVGKKVVKVRPLMPEEITDFGWDDYNSDSAIVIIFDDGTAIIPMQDAEGNGSGVLAIEKVA